jgi:hypothetical protein
MPANTPPQLSPLAEQQEPLDTLRGFTTIPQTFNVYYKNMVEEGRNFGAAPIYGSPGGGPSDAPSPLAESNLRRRS